MMVEGKIQTVTRGIAEQTTAVEAIVTAVVEPKKEESRHRMKRGMKKLAQTNKVAKQRGFRRPPWRSFSNISRARSTPSTRRQLIV
jgi:hypothetical protein